MDSQGIGKVGMKTLDHKVIFPRRPDPANVIRMDQSVLPMIVSMETTGMRISREHIYGLKSKMSTEMEYLQSQVEDMTGYSINISSGDQLANLMFDKMGLKQAGKERMTKSRARLAADSDVLKGMISQHPVVQVILDYKEREKLRSTYTTSLLNQADDNDRVHPDINHTGPETGRLACSNPNLQNIPTRTKLGKSVRGAFIPNPGNVLGTCDASQIEMRCQAHDSQALHMMNIFWSFDDLYWGTAEGMYKRIFSEDERKHGVEQVTGQSFKQYYRNSAKIVTLGVSYDISAEGLLDQFLVWKAIEFLTGGESVWDYDKYYQSGLANCVEAIKAFYATYPELLEARKKHHRRARKYGMVWDDFGRIRWIPQVHSTHRWIVSEGLRAAGNMPIQGLAAGIVKLWMAVIWDRIESYWWKRGIRPLIAVHDELVVEGPKPAVEDFLPECSKLLRNLIPYELINVPLESNTAIGSSWADLEK